MILLASGDSAGQKEIREQDRGLSLYRFFEDRRPLFCDDPPVSVVCSAVSAASVPLRFTGGGVFRVGFRRWRRSCIRACGSVSG